MNEIKLARAIVSEQTKVRIKVLEHTMSGISIYTSTEKMLDLRLELEALRRYIADALPY